MAGTRTAPTVNGTPTYLQVSLHWIDHQGQKRADAINVPAAATPAEIEAVAATAQLISNGSLYRVSVGEIYNSTEDASNASEEVWTSVKDSLVVQAKTAANVSERGFIPAVNDEVFVDGTTDIDPVNVALGNYFAALLALIGGTYSIVGARFSQRKQINQQVKI